MEVTREAMLCIVDNITDTIDKLDKRQVNKLIRTIERANKVFIYGAGRSGLAARAFAMRLMHLDIDVYVVGGITTPSIHKGDLLLVLSGSGQTTSVVNAAGIAKKIGAKIALITSYPDSPVGKLADYIITIEGRIKLEGSRDYNLRQLRGDHRSLAPLGTLFEITTFIFLDGIISELMARMGKREEDLKARHATIE